MLSSLARLLPLWRGLLEAKFYAGSEVLKAWAALGFVVVWGLDGFKQYTTRSFREWPRLTRTSSEGISTIPTVSIKSHVVQRLMNLARGCHPVSSCPVLRSLSFVKCSQVRRCYPAFNPSFLIHASNHIAYKLQVFLDCLPARI